MTHQEITNGNRMIKEWMGSTIKIAEDNVKDIPLAFLKLPDLKFHQSWKWLMPVVMKMEEEKEVAVRIEGTRCAIISSDDKELEAEADTKLEAVWQAVVAYLANEH